MKICRDPLLKKEGEHTNIYIAGLPNRPTKENHTMHGWAKDHALQGAEKSLDDCLEMQQCHLTTPPTKMFTFDWSPLATDDQFLAKSE